MKRSMMKTLVEWKQRKKRKPLILKGSRQVGKTYLIREFGHEYYNACVEINFEREKEYVDIFKKTRNPKELLVYLQLSFPSINFNEHTLLFLDELQACPDALTTLKFMAEEFPCDIICSGSALGVAISSTSSFPVGYVETITLYPMSFSEFLLAMGIQENLLELLRTAGKTMEPLPELLHEKMNALFSTYMMVGGMPDVVATYCNTKSIKETLAIQRRIVEDYYNDMAKYASGSDRIKARECFASIPQQLAKDNKKFQYKVVKEGYNARYYESSLQWLEDSNLILKVHRLRTIQKPLQAYAELGVFKVYMGDTGLLMSQFEEGDIKTFLQGDLGIYKGALYENITAQILQRMQKRCYYYEPSQTSEIDFIIYYNGDITPIEVKAGRNTKSISLQNFVKTYEPANAFRFSAKNASSVDTSAIHYVPLYLLEFILENESPLL